MAEAVWGGGDIATGGPNSGGGVSDPVGGWGGGSDGSDPEVRVPDPSDGGGRGSKGVDGLTSRDGGGVAGVLNPGVTGSREGKVPDPGDGGVEGAGG